MAGMQRFVTYIYAYENGQKGNNVGYAKIETRGNRGQIDIHFLNGGIYRGKGSVAFLFAKNGKWICVPIGEFAIENGTGTVTIAFQTDVLAGTDFGFSKIDGVYIVDSENGNYLSFWRDVNVTDFRETNFVEYSQDALLSETVERPGEKQPVPDVVVQKEMIEDAEQESLHTMEVPMRNVFPVYTMEDIWQNFERTKNPVKINDKVTAIQMELSDLRELPKQYWYLGNNSFLLHGFFNYHHLLFGKLPNGRWFLGVPGVYERQERVMASVFGFPGFMAVGEPFQEQYLSSDQITPREKQQGVWYHVIED